MLVLVPFEPLLLGTSGLQRIQDHADLSAVNLIEQAVLQSVFFRERENVWQAHHLH